MAILYKANGNRIPIKPTNGKKFTLDELQGYVGGDIQLGAHFDPTSNLTLVMNEDGKNQGLTVNLAASVQYRHFPADWIVGDVLVCRMDEIE